MPDFNLNLSDPISSVCSAIIAISGAVEAEILLDTELARHDADYRTLLIEERSFRKAFWEPLQKLLAKIAEEIKITNEE
jgi:hypothetical protein